MDDLSIDGDDLIVHIEQSFDNIQWQSRNASVDTTAKALVRGQDANATSSPYVRLRIRLDGTRPTAHVRVWVAGRDPLEG